MENLKTMSTPLIIGMEKIKIKQASGLISSMNHHVNISNTYSKFQPYPSIFIIIFLVLSTPYGIFTLYNI